MPNLVKIQAQKNNKLTSATHHVGKGLGASLLCLSVLAGCASTSDQEQPIDPMNDATQAEAVTSIPESNVTAEQSSTEPSQAPENTDDSQPQSASSQETTSQSETTDTTDKTTADESNQAPITETAENAMAAEPTMPATADSAVATSALAVDEQATIMDTEESTPDAATSLEQTSDQPLVRSSKNLGKSYGIWTLKDAGNGFCKLKTPTLQIGGKEYSSQIWLDIEEQKIVVNAYMPLDIEHPKTGIQIDNQALTPFTEKVNSTRAVVVGDMTSQLASGKELHIFINGKEVGKQVLKRNVKLTGMNNAISALRSCSK